MHGPSVSTRREVNFKPVGLHDLASTITTWFRLGPMPGSDGVALLRRPLPRRDILLQGTFETQGGISYRGLRTPRDYKFMKYGSGAVELYNLNKDPHELHNLAKVDTYQSVVRALSHRLVTLRNCAGASCL